jgi:beta-N-acetylhexosaminidase
MEERRPRADARRRAVRRRQLAVAGAAAAAFLLGAVAGAGGRVEKPAPRAVTPHAAAARQSAAAQQPPAAQPKPPAVDRAVGGVIVLRFKGTTVPAYVRRALRAGHATGAILFRDNVRSPGQLRALTRTLREAGGPGTLIAVDQEGGPIRIVSWAPPAKAAPAQGPTAGADAHAGATALRALGINVSLAPVADVPSVEGSAIAGRQLGSTPQAASRAVTAAVRGWRAGHVAPAAKHFPGLGGARVNTDFGSVAIRRSRRQLDDDLAPFKAAIGAGVPLVMISHAVYPALDADHIASQSKTVVTSLLRDRLAFKGVTVTDSLEAAAVRATGSVQHSAEASLRAGVDLMLTTGRGSFPRVYHHLVAAARRDPGLLARIREAAASVERLRHEVA